MAIQATNGYSAIQAIVSRKFEGNPASYSHPQAATDGQPAATNDLNVALSEQGLALQHSTSVHRMMTASGPKNIDLDQYFNNPPTSADLSGELSNLLLPSMDNLTALQQHISAKFPGFLSSNGIPDAPDSIRFDDQGKLVLPADYPYKEPLSQALDSNPAMLKALRTAHGLASHVAAIQATQPMRDELAQAKNQFEIDLILEKYSEFLGENRSQAYPNISLKFSGNGELAIQTQGATHSLTNTGTS